ncbi:MAG: iron-containing alcohol dehydrogenase [Candidatus Dormibacteraeota bacterium]|nr:iron-containing alcohol dehydrogenase [Candidatus Dormibacteraeota bacterium]
MGEDRTTLTAGRSQLTDSLFVSPGGRTISLPRLLLTGDDCVDQLGDSLRQAGVAPGEVLLVADSVLRDLGVVARIERILAGAGYHARVHGQIAGEPDLAGAESVVAAVRSAEYRAVIGVGGGSALDPAKLAAGLARNEGSVLEYLRGRQLERDSLPLALIPTTAGTGAEASKNTIVTHEGRKFVISSPFLCPAVAVLDPKLTLSCPPGVTAATGMDALAHAVEATLSLWATPFTTLNALSATRTLARWLPVVHSDGANLEARRAMLYAAHLAGLAINASTLLGHSIAYTIATRTHLPHGVTTAMALPYCVAYNAAGATPQVTMLAAELEVEPASLAPRLAELSRRMGMPSSLREVGVDQSQLSGMVEQCLTTYPRPNNPVPFDKDRLMALLGRFLDGDLEGAVGDSRA